MNSSWVGWICGGTNVPGGSVACQENEPSETCFGTYVWPRMFQEMPSMPVPAFVTPAVIAVIARLLPHTRPRGGPAQPNHHHSNSRRRRFTSLDRDAKLPIGPNAGLEAPPFSIRPPSAPNNSH